MIDLTPLEVRKKKGDFRRVLRGYEATQVDDFLDLAADRIEQLVRDNTAMGERLTELERRVAEYRDRERALTDALVSAQEMREEIRAQTTREAELTRRTAVQESEARLREAEQRSESLVRDAEQRAQTLLRDAEQRAQTLVRESEQHAATTVRAAEQGADDTLRRAQMEAEAELRQAQQEAAALHSELVQVREREEETLRRLRLQQQQQLSMYRNFLERELAELEIMTRALAEPTAARSPAAALPAEADSIPAEGGESSPVEEVGAAGPSNGEEASGRPRDAVAAAAAAVLAQSFLVEERERVLGDELRAELDLDRYQTELDEAGPFEPEPVYEEDLERRRVPPGGMLDEDRPEDGTANDTEALLENAALAGYDLELHDELDAEPELLLEETEPEPDRTQKEGDDWLSSMIDEEQ